MRNAGKPATAASDAPPGSGVQSDHSSHSRDEAMGFSVLIPAYQETECIAGTLAELMEILPIDSEVIVGAADSLDGGVRVTGKESPTGLQALTVGDPRVNVCDGGGLSEAVRNAARLASCELVVVMDADGQHDPAVLNRMISLLRVGNDVCVGELDQTGKRWYRVALTYASSLLARLRMPRRTRGLKSPQSGFFAARRSPLTEALADVGPHDSKPLTALLMSKQLKSVGVRTKLRSRTGGESKVSWRIIVSDARFLLRRCGR